MNSLSWIRTMGACAILLGCDAGQSSPPTAGTPANLSLWELHATYLEDAKYIDLTHAFEPQQAVWGGFGRAEFRPARARSDMGDYASVGDEFAYEDHGFIATEYLLPTDQYGTQLDPPAHWNDRGATISDIPASFAIHPLVVINISEKVQDDEGYHLQVDDIVAWESAYGRIPTGSVVMVRSDWHKRWGEIERFNEKPFPGVGLEAIKFMHEQRGILFHGHEPLDTDTTPNLEGEYWLMHNNYAQAEGVANLDLVPERGALIMVGFAKPLGGTGGYARYIAIAPPDWPHGETIASIKGKPLPVQESPLRRDVNGVLRPE
ncbi:MAG: cyclase family protein [Pseudomonadota bacterium]